MRINTNSILLLLFTSIFLFGCKKRIILPSITTLSVTNIFANEAFSGGVISSQGSGKILSRGVVWSTSQNPTISLITKTTDSSGIGTFTSLLFGLSANTKYYVRAYATIASGTTYGNEVSFTTNDVNISDGLVAYYPFTGNAGDSSGNGFNGILSLAKLAPDRKNIPDRCFDFNYLGARIQIPVTSQINNAKELSISKWINILPNGGGATFGNWYYYASGGGPVGVMIGVSSSNISCSLNDGQDIIGNLYVEPSKWHHITFVFSGLLSINNERVKLYFDGIEIKNTSIPNSKLIPSNIGSQANDTFIGGRQCENYYGWCYNGLSPYFQGKIDDIRIYNRALSQSEITYLATH